MAEFLLMYNSLHWYLVGIVLEYRMVQGQNLCKWLWIE